MIDIPTAEEYLEAQKSVSSDLWKQGFNACRQLVIELGALDDLADESQQLGLYDDPLLINGLTKSETEATKSFSG